MKFKKAITSVIMMSLTCTSFITNNSNNLNIETRTGNSNVNSNQIKFEDTIKTEKTDSYFKAFGVSLVNKEFLSNFETVSESNVDFFDITYEVMATNEDVILWGNKMKKNKYLILAVLFPISLSLMSCMDYRIVNINNVVWRDDFFNIEATSNQLQNQLKFSWDDSNKPNDYFSSITIMGEVYPCVISLTNEMFCFTLFNKEKNDYNNNFGGNGEDFLHGNYYPTVPEKVIDQDYIYFLNLIYYKNSSFITYCDENNISYPTSITLYGYENK